MNNEIKHNQWTVLTQKHSLISKAFFCRVFALCVFLTLSLHPITAQANTQQSTPDHINQAQAGVKKYYPQYDEYFKEIFIKINKLDNALIEVINSNLDNAIKKSKNELRTEKQIYTMVLMTIEKLDWKDTFCNDNSITKDEEEREDEEIIASVITKIITKWLKEKTDEINKIIEKQKKIREKITNLLKKDVLTREDTEELLNVIEELYNLIENTEYINDNRLKFIFNEYYTRSRDIWRKPNETWKKIIKWLKDHQE